MEDGCDLRQWDDLIPDALGLIFRNLSLKEILTVVPVVCKSWKRAVTGPYCWQDIDIEEWSRHCRPENIDRMLRLLVTWSCGSLRRLSVSGISNDPSFAFVANHAKYLQTLSLQRSEISDSIVEQVAAKLSAVTFLDLSYCSKIGAHALEAVGKHCKFLTSLRRIMHPLEVIDKGSQDDEALAIASTMPKLKHLEVAYLLVRTASMVEVLTKCTQLELLDIRGCWDVKLDENFLKKFPALKLVGPNVTDFYDVNYSDYWDSCSDYSDSSGYLAWDFVADDMDDDYDELPGNLSDEEQIQDVGMLFYNDVEPMDAGYEWPLDP
ncbi:OLC1v1009330C1 [Oldenlandia corymbosa var. corymbosa]|nr:OLC1v1009330C1 [Oldenlandia corymbosa var. corymbosa]